MINDQLNLFSVAEGVFFITRFKECARRGGWMIKLNWKFHKNKLPSLEKLCISSRLYHHSQKKRSLAITRERTSMNRYCTYSARTILAICSMQPKRKKENACNCSRLIWFLTVHLKCTAKKDIHHRRHCRYARRSCPGAIYMKS